MSISIGRAGLGTGWLRPELPITINGGRLTMSGWIVTDSNADMLVARQQVLGLTDSLAEEGVPVVDSDDDRLTGYYRVTNASVDRYRGQANVARFQVEMEQIKGFAYAQIETLAQRTLLTNGVGIVASEVADYLWFPSSYLDVDAVLSTAERTTETGNVITRGPTGGGTEKTSYRWTVAPSDYYDGAVAVEVGAGFRPLVGSQVEASVLGADIDDWRINNGLVRVSWDASDSTLVLAHFDGSAPWETAKKYRVGIGGINGGTGSVLTRLTELTAVRVLACRPEMCTVRLALARIESAVAFVGGFTLDITVLRGEYMARLVFSHADAQTWVVARDTSEAATALSSSAPFSAAAGLRATANDADGNRYVIATPVANSQNTTVGTVAVTSGAVNGLFMVSSAVGGSGADGEDTPEQQVLEYLANVNPVQVVSVR